MGKKKRKNENEPKYGLIIREPYASMIVNGKKKWEIRTRKTSKRGEIYIITNGKIIGKAKIIDVKGPFTVNDLAKHENKHQVNREILEKYAKQRKLYAWVLSEPVKFDNPIKIEIPRGAIVWVKIKQRQNKEEKTQLK